MKVPCVLLVYWAVCLWENLIRLSMSMLLQSVYLFVKWFVCLCKCCCYGSIYAYVAAMGLSMLVLLKYVCLSSIDGVTYVWVCCVTLICLCMYLCVCITLIYAYVLLWRICACPWWCMSGNVLSLNLRVF